MRRFRMTKFICLALAATLSSGFAGPSFAEGPRDIKVFVKHAFKAKIEAIKSGIYCRALFLRLRGRNLLCHRDRPENLCVVHKRMA